MSILIKGMKMPKDCIKCPFCLLADGHWKCLADGSFADFGGTCRPPKCQLIEVPTPHGRLIDADALQFGADVFLTREEAESALKGTEEC